MSQGTEQMLRVRIGELELELVTQKQTHLSEMIAEKKQYIENLQEAADSAAEIKDALINLGEAMGNLYKMPS